MILYLLAVVAALVVTFGGVRVGLPALHAWQYGRCLARIAVLERDVGLPVSNPELLPRPRTSPDDVARRWAESTTRASGNCRSAADNYRNAVLKSRIAVIRCAKDKQPSDDFRPQWRRY